ncbi:MAG: helix-turn-helix transcriptional regulator [Erysipelotrichaceae bacterium]|nr:helix-turn-helix transcriptional regulator [Erysipelotrichaceae bacterium]
MKEKQLKKKIDHSIAEQIKAKRIELGYSMSDMGKLLGVQKSTYFYYESGNTSMDITTIIVLCDHLGLRWQDVIQNANESARRKK